MSTPQSCLIFLVDDDLDFCEQVIETLSPFAQVQGFQEPEVFLKGLERNRPDLILIDLNLNHEKYNGFDLVKLIKKRTDSHFIPILMISGADDVYSQALRTGIDDYIQKPILPRLLVDKVEHVLYQNKKKIHTNALTGLPDIYLITEEFERSYGLGKSFSMAYIDIDNFKSFNDQKGVKTGDIAIQLIAQVFLDVRQNYSKDDLFTGHLGGDDFFLLGKMEEMEKVTRQVYSYYKEESKQFFTQEELEKESYKGTDREGNDIDIPLLTLSTGIMHFDFGDPRKKTEIPDFQIVTELSSKLKKAAKQQKGYSIVNSDFWDLLETL